MNNQCCECNDLIIIEPFYCMACSEPMCTFCYDVKHEICTDCVLLTETISESRKCHKCDENDAVVDQLCETCGYLTVVSCLKCIKRSAKGKIECDNCWKNITKCPVCNTVYLVNSKLCEACKKEICLGCIVPLENLDGTIVWCCFSHRWDCSKCSDSFYQTPSRRCQYEYCLQYACPKGLFKPNIRVCHKHVSQCEWCKLPYPMTHTGVWLHFKYNPRRLACRNCFYNVMLLFWVNGQTGKRLPKDILSIIAIYLIKG